MELDGKVAVVTGAASGIGLAMTRRFISEGMKVVMADIEEVTLEARAESLTAEGADLRTVACDVSDADQVAALRDAAVEAFGAVHVLCNNAGVASGAPGHKTSPGVWDWVIGVNVLGVAYGVSAFAPLMVDQGEGHIVNTASEAGLTATPMLGSYHVSKYAVVGLSESLRMELEGSGVGVSCLCPELVDTKIFEATRNAPASLGIPAPPEIRMADIAAMMGTVAMDPADVAGRVVYAIRADQFWILTHQATVGRVHKRNSELEELRNPKFSR